MALDYTTGMIASMAARDPEKFAEMMAKQGVRPPVPGQAPAPSDQLGQLLAPSGPLAGLASAVAPTPTPVETVTPGTATPPRPAGINPSDALMRMMLGARPSAPPNLAALLGGR